MAVNLDRFPRQQLGFFPTPIQKLPRLSRELGIEVWAKRDDIGSGLAFGGNKTRKLEWLIPDALAQGCDTLVSIGGVQSNHTRQVAAAAAVTGLKCRLVQAHWAPWEDPVYDRVGNILLSRLMGARTEQTSAPAGEDFTIDLEGSLQETADQVRLEGGAPYVIPAGASDHPLGGLGYVEFANEVERQEAGLGVFFDTVITATGTGSTQAGMVVAFAGQDRPREVIGIDTLANSEETHRLVTKVTRATADLVRLRKPIEDAAIIVDGRFAGPAYGVPNDGTIEAIRMGAELEAMITDPVYEGKSLAGLIALARSGEIARGSKVLYVHLGGVPALDAYYRAFE
ncbi:MAG: 1-aminocyclopropane-1-carboxylate deaminase [Minwuiales bacterium]|nr:1-aminocyclopropane-1-carboxylate deaminase [Minwuiales bacterium]